MALSSSSNASPKAKNSPQIKRTRKSKRPPPESDPIPVENPEKTRKSKRPLAESDPIPDDSTQPSQPPQAPVRKRTKDPGLRVVGRRIYDSENGQTCHQCRQKTMDFVATCKKITKDKPCKIKFCHKCLLNRYGEKAEEVDLLEDWECPKCRNNCNCSFCRKKSGLPPTGILAHTAKASGYQSVSQMLTVKGGTEDSGSELGGNTEDLPVSVNTREDEKEKVTETVNIDNNKPKKSRKRKERKLDPTNIQNNAGNDNVEDKPKGKNGIKHRTVPDADIPLPQGIHLTTVAGVELPSADVGPALQFLEFCNAFEEILELKKGEAQSVLQELASGCKLPRRQYSSVIPFHVKLLSLLQKDMGEEHFTSPSTNGNSWFHALGKCISISQYALKEIPMESFDDGYENLDTSKRLRLLNFLCHEALCTKELRGWIDNKNKYLIKSRKEAKANVLPANEKEKHLKKQLEDEIAKKIISTNGAPLFVSEHDALIEKIKSEAENAHQEKLAAINMVPKKKHRSDAVRTEPIISTGNGLTFWNLSGFSTEPNILLQDVGKCDSDESEKWFTYDVELRKQVENYISYQRKKMLRSQVVRDSSPENKDTTDSSPENKDTTESSPENKDTTVKNESSDSPLRNESD